MQAVMLSSLLLLEAGITAVALSLLQLSSLLLLAFPALSDIPCCCWCSCCIPGVAGIFAASIPADPGAPILVGTYCTMRHIILSDYWAIEQRWATDSFF
jgi:hypothetical protein